ncbi:hypothetical protein PAESOLCIP111_06019 [Paenibacillus solanacearum]|uniref:Uncharacterized protein n=1 Tax=Paenibacillus solanacearum TaxID=2048548 RepID=A0A916K8S9_9BACL|nr:hypothetical protein PAESOLCIP111_06019 [Paenibacillus solanacearum]
MLAKNGLHRYKRKHAEQGRCLGRHEASGQVHRLVCSTFVRKVFINTGKETKIGGSSGRGS